MTETNVQAIVPAPSEQEAAAIVAAVEHFARATARPARAPDGPSDPWQRAAILEGVSRDPHAHAFDPWINT